MREPTANLRPTVLVTALPICRYSMACAPALRANLTNLSFEDGVRLLPSVFGRLVETLEHIIIVGLVVPTMSNQSTSPQYLHDRCDVCHYFSVGDNSS